MVLTSKDGNIEANYYIIIVEVRNIFSIFLYG